MRLRLPSYAKVALGATGLVAVLFAAQAPAYASVTATATATPAASAAAAKIVPYPKALVSGRKLALAVTPRTMTGSAWKTSKDVPGGCPANPGAVSVNAGGYAELKTSGDENDCTWIASPKAMPTRAGYVYEADVYFSNFTDWPGFWMLGNIWPTQGELDAAEPNFGVSYVTWHQAACNASRSDTEISTNPWAYACKTTVTPVSKNIKPGWNIIDIAWTASGVQIYYNGTLYLTIHENVTTGKNDDPMRVVLSEGSCEVGSANECVAGALGTAGNVQVKYVRVFS